MPPHYLYYSQVRTIRYLVSAMPDHSAPDKEFPFNGSLTACVEFAGFRVFAQAVQPLESCAIACGWFMDANKRKCRFIEPDSRAKSALQLVASTLNLKRTMGTSRRGLFEWIE